MLKEMPLSSLIPADFNPRKALKPGDSEYEKLKRSIESFGLVLPLILNEQSGRLVGGHQRLTVLKDLGYETVPVMVLSLDDAHEKALNLALNKISGDWDEAKLLSLLSDLDEISVTGFDEAELETLIGKLYEADLPEDDGFDVDAALAEPDLVSPGELWTLGRHTLYCQRNTELPDLELKANLVVSSFNQKMPEIFSKLSPSLASGASVYVFHKDTDGIDARLLFDDKLFHLSGICLIKGETTTQGDYLISHKPVLYGFMKKGRHRWYGGRRQTTYWTFDTPREDGRKTIPLLAYTIKNSSAENSVVLELNSDAGEGLMAAEKLNRSCITVTDSPEKASAILRRYAAYTGDVAGVKTAEKSYLEVLA